MADNTSPLTTRFIIFLLGWVLRICTRSDGTLNSRLLRLIDFKASAPATKLINNTRVFTSDVTVESRRNLWFRIFTPSKPKPLPLIVYFHGGGFSNYAPDSKPYDALCSRLAAAVPAVVVSVNYRHAPMHRWPSQYEDGFDVLKFIDAKHEEVLPHSDVSKCFISGDSAGGNIAHHVTIRVVEKCAEFDKVRIVGMVGVQPFFGGEERTEAEVRLRNAPIITVKQTDVFWREFLPVGADRNHPAANVFGGEMEGVVGFPSSLVIVGGNDPLQDWGRRYVEWLKRCGKTVELTDYPNVCHFFYAFPRLPESALLMDRVKDFVHKQLHSN